MFLETFGFVRWASNLIGYKRASFGIIRPFNITSTRVYGVEMLTTAELSRLLVLELSATWMNPHNSVNEVTQRSTFIPFRSEWIVSPGVEVFKDLTIPDLPLDRASLGVRFHYQSWQAADPAGGIVLPARHLLDLNASVRLFHDQLTIRGSINNTLNEEITDIVGLPAPGRNVHMSFEGTW
jgi:outer membrane cobalamin receptor